MARIRKVSDVPASAKLEVQPIGMAYTGMLAEFFEEQPAAEPDQGIPLCPACRARLDEPAAVMQVAYAGSGAVSVDGTYTYGHRQNIEDGDRFWYVCSACVTSGSDVVGRVHRKRG